MYREKRALGTTIKYRLRTKYSQTHELPIQADKLEVVFFPSGHGPAEHSPEAGFSLDVDSSIAGSGKHCSLAAGEHASVTDMLIRQGIKRVEWIETPENWVPCCWKEG